MLKEVTHHGRDKEAKKLPQRQGTRPAVRRTGLQVELGTPVRQASAARREEDAAARKEKQQGHGRLQLEHAASAVPAGVGKEAETARWVAATADGGGSADAVEGGECDHCGRYHRHRFGHRTAHGAFCSLVCASKADVAWRRRENEAEDNHWFTRTAAGARARGGNAVVSSYARQAVPSRVELAEERAREVAQLATALGAEATATTAAILGARGADKAVPASQGDPAELGDRLGRVGGEDVREQHRLLMAMPRRWAEGGAPVLRMRDQLVAW